MSTTYEQSSGSAFGHPVLAQQLAKRIRRHFKQGERTGENSLVIGIFGEWGSGKSNLLHLVRDEMQPDSENTETPVITVAFNPWRYEKEEHLIVPLLKTTQSAVADWIISHESAGDTTLEVLKQGGAFLGASVMAFVAAFKTKFGVPGTDVSIAFEGKKFLDEFERLLTAKKGAAFEDMTSAYYEFQTQLRAYTSAEKPGFRLLFLIDDLDRCLPEKAVEMLESIKLFLDVEGCAFVLALDDEVVERGILHRYRDYLFQQDMGTQYQTHLPITGQEYLEKIIQLPFRLPAPTRTNIRFFLQEREPELFAGVDDLEGNDGDDALLDLFVDCIPPVPRKLIRAVDLLKLLQDILDASGRSNELELLPLAKLTLLQLFAPDLYRFGRRYDLGFMARLEKWVKQPYWGSDNFIERTELVMLGQNYYDDLMSPINRIDAIQDLEGSAKNDWSTFQKYGRRLYQCFEQVAHNRSGFDPERLVRMGTIGHVPLVRYYSFMEDALPEQSDGSDEVLPSEEVGAVDRTSSSLELEGRRTQKFIKNGMREIKNFLELLLSSEPANWLAATQLEELRGKKLNDITFLLMLAEFIGDEYPELLANAQWWAAWNSIITDKQFERLAKETQQFSTALEELKPDCNAADLESVGLWLVKLSSRRKAMLETSLKPFRDWAVEVVEKGQLDQKKRAKVGDLLGQVGDPRFHDESLFCLPEAFCSEPEPQLGFVEITDDYAMGRYAVTVAQYARYLAASDVDEPKNWQEQLQYPNRPVIYVSWYDGVNYAEWLTEQLQAAQHITPAQLVRLPTEAQWQQAACAETKQEYPWGSGWDDDKANAAANIEHPSVVGMYPLGASPYRVMDMTGNVWEWCLNKYDALEVNDVDQSGDMRSIRGGSWDYHPFAIPCGVREEGLPDYYGFNLGFRVVLSY